MSVFAAYFRVSFAVVAFATRMFRSSKAMRSMKRQEPKSASFVRVRLQRSCPVESLGDKRSAHRAAQRCLLTLTLLTFLTPASAEDRWWRLETALGKENNLEAKLIGRAIRKVLWLGQEATPQLKLRCIGGLRDVEIDWKLKGVVGESSPILKFRKGNVETNTMTFSGDVDVDRSSLLAVGNSRLISDFSRLIQNSDAIVVYLFAPDRQLILAEFSGSPIANDDFRSMCGDK
jgi:hypothetical protein